MTTQEIIDELQKQVDTYGDRPFNIYGSFSKKNIEGTPEVFYDDELKDICIGIYA